MTVVQGSLLDLSDGNDLPTTRGAFERTDLGDGAWIDICRNWVVDPASLFDALIDDVPWVDERRKMFDRILDVPRRMCFYEQGDVLPDARLDGYRESLSDHYRDEDGAELKSTGLCLYRSGQDSVAWHGDRIGRALKSDVVIAIISLGDTRTMAIRPRGGGVSTRFALNSGDLFVMGGSCQRFFEHAIPKTTRPVGHRMSIQFRPAGVR